jgi:mRNA-degrading endonuclease toxin of MazEF toxin-antitoxin module
LVPNHKFEIYRGDIILADLKGRLDLAIMNKVVPVIVVSNDKGNLYSTILSVIPISNEIELINQFYPQNTVFKEIPTDNCGIHVLIPNNNICQDSVALPELITTISRTRVTQVIGHCSPLTMNRLDIAMNLWYKFYTIEEIRNQLIELLAKIERTANQIDILKGKICDDKNNSRKMEKYKFKNLVYKALLKQICKHYSVSEEHFVMHKEIRFINV